MRVPEDFTIICAFPNNCKSALVSIRKVLPDCMFMHAPLSKTTVLALSNERVLFSVSRMED